MCPINLRKQARDRLAKDLDPAKAADITQEIPLDVMIGVGVIIVAGKLHGWLS